MAEPIFGTEGSDLKIGSDADDIIYGLGGNDHLEGRGGNDTLDGGSGNDILIGGSGVDTLTGGLGADVYSGTVAELNGDHITGLSIGDRIVLTNLATANFGLVGNTITFGSGSAITVDGLGAGLFVVRPVGSGFELRLQSAAKDDFNGDGRSDILLRQDDGSIFNLLGQQNGAFANNGANSFQDLPTSWHVAGTGDFNGDSRVDVLWRNDNGTIIDWLSTSTGGFTNNTANSTVAVGLEWNVAGVGDFNGDGNADILWRNDNGVIYNFLANDSGGFTNNGDLSYVNVDNVWSVAATADFNGDGRDDILWRNSNGAIFNFLGKEDGGVINNGDNSWVSVSNSWHVVGTGDFNGDTYADILWRNDNGAIFNFLGNATGGVVNNGDNSYSSVDLSWEVAAIGDYNGDAIDDILWRHENGTITDWLGTTSGGFVANDANTSIAVGLDWHVQNPPEAFL